MRLVVVSRFITVSIVYLDIGVIFNSKPMLVLK